MCDSEWGGKPPYILITNPLQILKYYGLSIIIILNYSRCNFVFNLRKEGMDMEHIIIFNNITTYISLSLIHI